VAVRAKEETQLTWNGNENENETNKQEQQRQRPRRLVTFHIHNIQNQTMNSFSNISNSFRSVPRHTKCVACAGAIAPNEVFFCARLGAKLKNLEKKIDFFRFFFFLQRRAPRRARLQLGASNSLATWRA
jgi:predicted nucleic acid-binding Zn ribbon protein